MPNGARQILKTEIATGEVMEYPSTLAVHVHIFECEKTWYYLCLSMSF